MTLGNACSTCASLMIPDHASRDKPWNWLCTRAPRLQPPNGVTGEGLSGPPYWRCEKIREIWPTDCLIYEQGNNQLHPKEMPDAA